MWFWHRKTAFKLSAPVRGHHVTLSNDSALLLAIDPTVLAVYAPLNGEIVALSNNSARIIGLDGQSYRLALAAQAGNFEWQVRIGDSVSPISLLGTLSQNLSKTAVVTCEQISVQEIKVDHQSYAFNY